TPRAARARWGRGTALRRARASRSLPRNAPPLLARRPRCRARGRRRSFPPGALPAPNPPLRPARTAGPKAAGAGDEAWCVSRARNGRAGAGEPLSGGATSGWERAESGEASAEPSARVGRGPAELSRGREGGASRPLRPLGEPIGVLVPRTQNAFGISPVSRRDSEKSSSTSRSGTGPGSHEPSLPRKSRRERAADQAARVAVIAAFRRS